MEKAIYVLSIQGTDAKEFTDLVNSLRPLARQYNLIVTSKELIPLTLEGFKETLTAQLTALEAKINAQKEAESKEIKSNIVMTPEQLELDKKIKEKAKKVLEAEPPKPTTKPKMETKL